MKTAWNEHLNTLAALDSLHRLIAEERAERAEEQLLIAMDALTDIRVGCDAYGAKAATRAAMAIAAIEDRN